MEPQVTRELALQHGMTAEEYDLAVEALGRPPTYTELGIVSVMWSEHCSYKSSRVHLKRLPTEGPRLVQGPGENAGIVEIGEGIAAVFKMESHNHPSFIEPYQGAATGVGGIMRDVIAKAGKGVAVLGICNGFQILTESRLLPGALMRNAGLKFVSKPVPVEVEETQSMFTRRYKHKQRVVYPVAHGEGNYFADEDTLNRLEGEGRVVFRYASGENPNGSARDIAGVLNEKRNVMGLMPHPECACDPLLGPPDGLGLFEGLVEALS